MPGNPVPLTVKVCDAEAVLNRVDMGASALVLTPNVGDTPPFKATVRLVVLPVMMSMLPRRGPVGALAAKRTAMVVAATALLVPRGNVTGTWTKLVVGRPRRANS